MSAHFREECRHGTVIMQCRCPGDKRVVVRSLCPERCPFKSPPTGSRFPPPGVRVTEPEPEPECEHPIYARFHTGGNYTAMTQCRLCGAVRDGYGMAPWVKK